MEGEAALNYLSRWPAPTHSRMQTLQTLSVCAVVRDEQSYSSAAAAYFVDASCTEITSHKHTHTHA